MTEQTPEVVAAADVSPVSPKPIHTSATSPALVPSLHDHAETLDVAYLDSLTTAPFPFVTMPATPSSADPAADPSAANETEDSKSSPVADTIVVRGDDQDNDDVIDDESLDAYGEDDDEQEVNGDTAPAQPDVTEESSESMIDTPPTTSSPKPNVLLSESIPPPPVPSQDAEPAAAADSQDAPNVEVHSGPETQTVTEDPAATTDASVAAIPPTDNNDEQDSGGVDIQKLVDSITAPTTAPVSATTLASHAISENAASPPKQAAPPITQQTDPSTSQQAASSISQPGAPSISLPQSSSLPPKPVIPRQTGQAVSRPEDYHPSSLPPIPPSSFNTGSAHYAGPQLQQAWEAFQDDEKRYMTEAKWEKFPDNSRIFIGNLSSERVSKREVFELFHRFGRLAQISLKSAYGFVQYNSAEDAAAAMQAAQGAELGGRQIHLEFSRTQKKGPDREQRDRSPDRRGQRTLGGSGRPGLDRYDGRDRDQGRRRDDYRPGRSPSPRRNSYGRSGRDSRHSDSRRRSRSRSPHYGRYGQDSYRRRSPSPRRRGPSEPQFDMPQRYGDQVPDVQLILLQELPRDFVSWVEQAFRERGLRTNVMFVNPSFPRDSVLQRLALEGVHGVIEVDVRGPSSGKIPLRLFDRSTGSSVRFDDYQDLDPKVAAELVLRAKQPRAPPQTMQPAGYPGYPSNPYPPYPPQGYSGYAQPTPSVPPQPAGAFQPAGGLSAAEIADLAGRVDNNTLQTLLNSLSQGGHAPPSAGYMPQPQAPVLPQPTGLHYPAGPPQGPPEHNDAAAQVQNIMNALAQYR